MRGVRFALAVVALAAYVRHNRQSTTGSITYEADTDEYYALFSPKTSTWSEANLFCSVMGGQLPTLENNRRRQDAVHALMQLYSNSNSLYVWVADYCLRDACPPVDSSSWLYANYETQFADDGSLGGSPYMALGRHSNRLRHLSDDSASVRGVVCVYSSAWRNEECDNISGSKFVHFTCVDNGFCSRNTPVTEWRCLCNVGYGGISCRATTTPCASNPCQNGATCSQSIAAGGYTCQCRPGFSGVTCETNIYDCVNGASLCSGGQCEDRRNGYYCNCDGTGRRGPDCGEMINECRSRPCLNGGICVDQLNGYMCRCANGYDGDNCQNDPCYSDPCSNGGTCEFRVDGNYLCRCPNGYEGGNCQGDIDECGSSPCLNGGTCEDNIGRYMCRCAVGYDGRNCQVDINASTSTASYNNPTAANDGTTSGTTTEDRGDEMGEASAALGGGSGDAQSLISAAVGGVVGILAIGALALVKWRRSRAKARSSRSKGETASPNKDKNVAPKTDKIVPSSSGNIDDEDVYYTDVDSISP